MTSNILLTLKKLKENEYVISKKKTIKRIS